MRQSTITSPNTSTGTPGQQRVPEIIITPSLPRVSSLASELRNVLATITRGKTRSSTKPRSAPLYFELVTPVRAPTESPAAPGCAGERSTHTTALRIQDATTDGDAGSEVIDIRRSYARESYHAIGDIPSEIDECHSVWSISTESLFDTDEAADEDEDETSGQSAATSLESLWFRVKQPAADEHVARRRDSFLDVPSPRLRKDEVNRCDPAWRHGWHGGPVAIAATPKQNKRYGMHLTKDVLQASGYF